MDGKALKERVDRLAGSTTALVKRHIETIEPKPEAKGKKSTKTTKAAAPPVVVVKDVAPPGSETQASNTLPSPDEANTLFTNAGAIFPPYEPETLVMLFEHSNALRPNVDAYVTNIESFGARLEPTIDLEANDATDKIGDAIFLERLHASEAKVGPDTAQADYPMPEEIAQRSTQIKQAMRIEKARLETFLEGVVTAPESSLVGLREKTRTDLEVTGNAYWEVMRTTTGRVSQFGYVPAHSVRLLPISHETIGVKSKRRISPFAYETAPTKRRFRQFVQIVFNQIVYFKEYGDPRCHNAKTGRIYPDLAAMLESDPHAIPATEIVHFKLHSSRSPYGVPRWIGNLLAVLGSRASEEVNYLYFDNKAIPPVAVLVSGGRLAEGATKKIESYIKDHIRGKENFHKILVIEAVSAANANAPGIPDNGRTRITIEKLTSEQQKDGLFQEYDERNIDKIGAGFRLPRLVRGDARDFNRSTAEASLDFVEAQVFQPERNRFDEFMNRQVLPEQEVRFWRFVSNTPVSKEPDDLVKWITALVEKSILTPGEGRELARDVFNREFKKIDADWTKQPMPLTLAGAQVQEEDGAAPVNAASGGPATSAPQPAAPQDRNLAAVAANLSALRDKLTAASTKAAERISKEERAEFNRGEVIKIELSKAEIDDLIVPNDSAAE